MQSEKMMSILLEKGRKKKASIINKANLKITRFEDHEFSVWTDDDTTQQSISEYLNKRGFDNEIRLIYYKGKPYSCFTIATLEMLNWLRKNSENFPVIIFRRKKIRKGKNLYPWAKLAERTNVK